MKKKKNKPIRTYKHSSVFTNAGKIDKLYVLSNEYKHFYNYSMSNAVRSFFALNELPKYLPSFDISKLSERYKQTCNQQVASNLSSWISNIQNTIRSYIIKSNLHYADKEKLLYINSHKQWFSREIRIPENISIDKNVKGLVVYIQCPDFLLKLSRRMFKQAKGTIPVMRNITMILNANVCEIQISDKAKNFDYWIKVSTLERGKPIYLPIKTYNYFNKQKGTIKNSIQIILHKDKMEYGLIKELTPIEFELSDEILGIDVGLVKLLSLSNGNAHGIDFYNLIKKYDKIIQYKLRNAGRCGVKNTNTKKVKELFNKVRSLIKNEVGRNLNKVIDECRPETIVIESLKFKNVSGLSKKMNRLLNNAGLKQVHTRLEQKAEIYGFNLEQVNSAYTSQLCSKCGCVDKLNRKTQSNFECVSCGYKTNADYNAGKNIRARRSDSEITEFTQYKKVKEILETRFLSKYASYRLAET